MVVSKFTEHLEDETLVFDHEKSVSLEDILADNRARSMSTTSTSSHNRHSQSSSPITASPTSTMPKLKSRRWTFGTKK